MAARTGSFEERRVSRLHNVPAQLVRMIVRLIADGKAESPADAAEAIANFREASRLTREAAMGMVGYVMSLAPVRALHTTAMLGWMRHAGFAAELVRTASQSKNGALMPRIAALAGDPSAWAVVDALHGRLVASLRSATVKGEPMYSTADAGIEALATEIIRRLKGPVAYSKVRDVGKLGFRDFTARFLGLSRLERTSHIQTYGPMCIWDVSHVEHFDSACSCHDGSAPFNSDLYWDTSAATSMGEMFHKNSEFHGDLSTWDVSKVRKMSRMFQGAGIVDSGIGRWDVGSLQDASYMFSRAMHLSPKLDLSRWTMGGCTDLVYMFSRSAVTDNGIGKWTLPPSAATLGMLIETPSFTGHLPNWSPTQISSGKRTYFGDPQSPKSEDELIADLFVEARDRPAAWCAVQ